MDTKTHYYQEIAKLKGLREHCLCSWYLVNCLDFSFKVKTFKDNYNPLVIKDFLTKGNIVWYPVKTKKDYYLPPNTICSLQEIILELMELDPD